MSAVWLRLRAEHRRQWKAAVALALLIGLGGGAALAAFAGARRSDAALDGFLDYWRVHDSALFARPAGGSANAPSYTGEAEAARIRSLPEVRAATRVAEVVEGVADPRSPSGWRTLLAIVVIDRDLAAGIGRPIVVAGELPGPDAAFDAVVNDEMARRMHLRVGSLLRAAPFTSEQFEEAGLAARVPPQGPVHDLRVAAIVRLPSDLSPVDLKRDDLLENHSTLYLGPAYWRTVAPDVAKYDIIVTVDLRRGADDLDALRTRLRRTFGDRVVIGGNIGIGYPTETTGVRRTTRIESLALAGLGVLLALAAGVIGAQALRRQGVLDRRDTPLLRALGFTSGDLLLLAACRAAAIGVAGAIVAVIVAIALSPLTPIGIARRATVDPGLHADATVVALGALLIVVLVVVDGVLSARRMISPARARAPRATTGSALDAAPLPLPLALGAHLALGSPRRAGRAATRGAIIGVAAAVAALAAAVVFGASVQKVIASPFSYGRTWSFTVGNYANAGAARAGAEALARNRDIDAFAGVVSGPVTVDDEETIGLAMIPGRGVIDPRIVEGRAATGPGEIVVGSRTLGALDKDVGDEVTVTRPDTDRSVTLRVVGRALVDIPDDDTAEPGKGVVAPVDALRPLFPTDQEPVPSRYVLRVREGVDPEDAAERLRGDFYESTGYPAQAPDVVRDVQRVAYLPGVLAGVIAVLAIGALMHALLTGVRRRRRDLAVLKSLGAARRTIAAMIGWEAMVLGALGVLLGAPIGVLLGRFAWRLAADQLGVSSSAAIRVVPLTAIVAGTFVIVFLSAIIPALVARRLRPGDALRAE